jgi:hypothetical protein
MLKTTEGKWIVWDAKGQQLERWPVDARLLLKNGECTAEPPEGVTVSPPATAPTHVGVPQAPVATLAVASGGAILSVATGGAVAAPAEGGRGAKAKKGQGE